MGVRGRTCVGCRQVRPRFAVVRFVRAGEAVVVDVTGRRQGRGAYVCANERCFEQGHRRLSGALRGGKIDPEALRSEFRRHAGAGSGSEERA